MSDWPDLGALALLVAVADHGSLSAGARAAGVAQPNASRSIARLERHFGVKLLHRATSGSTLTDAGLLVVQWSRDVIDAARKLSAGAAALSGGEAQALMVAASQTVAEHLLPGWLGSLRELAPEVRVEVQVLNSRDVVTGLRDGRCDVGFVEGPRAPVGVHHKVVATDELVLVVAADHPLARRRKPLSGDDISRLDLIAREPGSGTRVALDDAIGSPLQPVLTFTSNAAVRVGVAAGSGAAVLSRLAVSDALHSGALRQVPVDLALTRQLRAAWTGPRRLRGAAAQLVTIASKTATPAR